MISVGCSIWGSGGAKSVGQKLLETSLFWGSSLDATSPDRVVDLKAVMGSDATYQLSVVSGQTDHLGGTTAKRLVPTAVSDTHWERNQATGLSIGTRTHSVVVYRDSAGYQGLTGSKYYKQNTSNVAKEFLNAITADLQLATNTSAARPSRNLQWSRSDRWSVAIHTDAALASLTTYQFPNWTALAGNGLDGVDISFRTWYQFPCATLPNRASGGCAASFNEATAPDLELPIAPDYRYIAWIDGTRCLDFSGDSRTFSLSGIHTPLSGTDKDWSLHLAWIPTVPPASDSTIWECTGGTSELKVVYLATGFLRLTRTADDGTSISVDFDNKLACVQQALTVQVRSGVAYLYVQGAQIGAPKTFASGKAATFTASRVGGGALLAKVAEIAISAASFSPTETYAIHASLCIRRSIPVGTWKAWLYWGQSNSMPNGIQTKRAEWSYPSASRCIQHSTGVPVEGAGWMVGHAAGKDNRRVAQGDLAVVNFSGKDTLIESRAGLAIIQFSAPGLPVSAFRQAGAQWAAESAAITDALTHALPVQLVGAISVIGETDADGGGAVYQADYEGWISEIEAAFEAYIPGGKLRIVQRKLSKDYSPPAAAGRVVVRAAQDAIVAAAPTIRASVVVDDDQPTVQSWWEDYPTNVHAGTPARTVEGTRFAAAIASLGL